MKSEVLVMVPPQGLDKAGFGELADDFDMHYAPTVKQADEIIQERGANIRGVITTGSFGLSGDQMRAMPELEFVQTRGMGFERLDLEAARERNIIVANSPSINFFSVAEHAMALLLTLVRDIPFYNDAVHQGRYEEARAQPSRPLIHGKQIGILGLGDIGAAIAKRAVAFDATVRYHNRRQRTDVPYEYVGSLVELARMSDILVVSCPGGDATRHLVNSEVLEALGPNGFLVNVGRGTVVEKEALVAALNEKRIRGAAVDVIEGEPEVPEAVRSAPNLIITPHVAANSPESRSASANNAMANLRAHFAGEPIKGRLV